MKGEDDEEGIQMLMIWCDIVIYNKNWIPPPPPIFGKSFENPWNFVIRTIKVAF